MADDLVKRLRSRCEYEWIDGYKRIEWEDEDAIEAADRIEELEKQISILQEYIKNAKKCIADGAYTEAYEHLELVVNDD